MANKKSGLGKGLGQLFLENSVDELVANNTLPLEEIVPNKEQPRKTFDETALEELAESIRQHGVLQPLLVRPLPGGGYQLVAGERRYRASRIAGLREVPVVIRELSDVETMEIAIIENLQREDLNPIEEAEGLQALIDRCGFTQDQVAASVGKSRPAIANSLRLLKLPPEVREMTKSGAISAGHARALLGLPNEALIYGGGGANRFTQTYSAGCGKAGQAQSAGSRCGTQAPIPTGCVLRRGGTGAEGDLGPQGARGARPGQRHAGN